MQTFSCIVTFRVFLKKEEVEKKKALLNYKNLHSRTVFVKLKKKKKTKKKDESQFNNYTMKIMKINKTANIYIQY